MTQIGPGWVMVTSTRSWVGTVIRVFTRSGVNHAAVSIGDQRMVEMQPSGALITPDVRYPQATWFRPPGTDDQLDQIATAARGLNARRVGYSFVDIAAQFAWRVLRVRPSWLAGFISSDRRMVCSQSADWCCMQAGVHLFSDGRLPGLVSPGDLQAAARENGWLTIVGTG